MAMDLGSKGLNLIEATHVILVEPTLNRANEEQAVGRVHRIGQTKYVSRFRFHIHSHRLILLGRHSFIDLL